MKEKIILITQTPISGISVNSNIYVQQIRKIG